MEAMKNIGVFDSGIGGLWILKQLEKSLPDYNYVFFADQAYLPYGTRSQEEITERSFFITDFLISKGCMVIVIACNTATSASIEKLRAHYPQITFVGIEPAIKQAVEQSKTGHIGVLATKVTTLGKKLHNTIEKFAQNAEVHSAIGDGLVELAEEGKADTDEAEFLLRQYIAPLLKYNIDALVLGCTHYSFFIPRIRKIIGSDIMIIDPAPAIARRVGQLLSKSRNLPLQNSPSIEFFTSFGDPKNLKEFLQVLPDRQDL